MDEQCHHWDDYPRSTCEEVNCQQENRLFRFSFRGHLKAYFSFASAAFLCKNSDSGCHFWNGTWVSMLLAHLLINQGRSLQKPLPFWTLSGIKLSFIFYVVHTSLPMCLNLHGHKKKTQKKLCGEKTL